MECAFKQCKNPAVVTIKFRVVGSTSYGETACCAEHVKGLGNDVEYFAHIFAGRDPKGLRAPLVDIDPGDETGVLH